MSSMQLKQALRAYGSSPVLLIPAAIQVHTTAALHLRLAVNHYEQGRIEEAQDSLKEGQSLVKVLQRCVAESESPLGRDLASVYTYLTGRLSTSPQLEALEVASQTLQSLAEAWESRDRRTPTL